MSGRADQILELRRRCEAGTILAPHLYATGGLLTVPGSHPINRWARDLPDSVDAETYDWSQRGVWVVRTPAEVREVVQRMVSAGMDGIKIVIESEVLTPPAEEKSPQMSGEMVDAAAQEARQQGLPVFAHATDPGEMKVAVDAGVRALVHLGSEPPGPDLLARMQEQGIYLVPTLSVYIWAGVWGDPADNVTEPFLRSGVEPRLIDTLPASPRNPTSPPTDEDWAYRRSVLEALKAAHDAGIKLVGGSDPPDGWVFHGYSIHHELELMVEAGISPMKALVIATRRAAVMLGEDDTFGTIEPGKRADLLILDVDPLEDIRNTRTLEVVVQEGQVIDRSSLLPDK